MFDMTEAEQIDEEIATLEEEQIVPLRLQYALSFRDHFDDIFVKLQASEDGQEIISRKRFDEWLEISGFGSEKTIPQKGTAEWTLWVSTRNKVRIEMNQASRVGEHGTPPYKLDTDKSNRSQYILRNLTAIMRVAFLDVANNLRRLAVNKNKDLGTWLDKMHTEVVQSNDPVLQSLVLSQRSQFKGIVNVTAFALSEFVDRLKEVQKSIDDAAKMRKLLEEEEKAIQVQLEHQEDVA
jgi:hypothetical protein